MRLNRTLFNPRSNTERRPGPDRLQNQYCLSHECYTPTEFALFGVGICIAGVLLGVVVITWLKNKCFPEDKYYEYTLDDPNSSMTNSSSRRMNGSLMNNTSSDEVANLMPRSDSGGFRSHKPDSVVAVQNQSDQVPHSQLQTDYIHKRQSMIHSQECIRDMPDIPPDLHD